MRRPTEALSLNAFSILPIPLHPLISPQENLRRSIKSHENNFVYAHYVNINEQELKCCKNFKHNNLISPQENLR